MDNASLTFQSDLIKYIQQRMTGSHDMDRIVQATKPSRRFILGSLAPKRKDAKEHPEEDPLGLADIDRSSIRARQMRVSILIPLEQLAGEHDFTIQFYTRLFYKIKSKVTGTPEEDETVNYETEDEQPASVASDNNDNWKRLDVKKTISMKLPLLSMPSLKHRIDFSQERDIANLDPQKVHNIVAGVWEASLSIGVSKFSEGKAIVHFYATNESAEDPTTKGRYERTLFDTELAVSLRDVEATQFCDEYDYQGFHQKYHYDFRTINCQAYWDSKDGPHSFRTSSHGLFRQERIVPRSSMDSIDITFDKLSSESFIKELEAVKLRFQNLKVQYLSTVPEDRKGFGITNGVREITWEERRGALVEFDEMVRLYERGVEILKTDSAAQKAFRKMNETFKLYYENKNDGEIDKRSGQKPSWRLFQIVFIIAAIRSIVSSEDLDVVDVLHVATGGGKSEAYFGLAVFSMFYEREMGIESGVTAIVKFPLRMLSIQQLDRLSSIVAYAEVVRKKDPIGVKGTEFCLGYYVGSRQDDFPDRYIKLRRKLFEDNEFTRLITPAPQSKILSLCPLCKEGNRGIVRLVDDPKGKRIIHVCDKNQNHRFTIYMSDREVFRYRPSLIVSTVDKWASLSQQRRARVLLGGNGSECPCGHGFIPSGDKCEDNKDEAYQCSEIGKNHKGKAPILSVQDEMHLLKEAFGTISSHFEGLIETIVSNNDPSKRLKHIAMSATLNGIDEQIRELYNKRTVVIPGKPVIGYGHDTDPFFETKDDYARLIVGMKPNIRDNHYASLRTILHLVEFLDKEQRKFVANKYDYVRERGFLDDKEALINFRHHLIPLTYHLKKQDAEDMLVLSGPVINDALNKTGVSKVSGIVLTGDRGLDELKEIIDRVKQITKEYTLDEKAINNAIYSPMFATSVVSHGVDLDDLNFMIFQGIPYSTAEYIQSHSRVGRLSRGIVFVWFYPNRVRDDSFFRNFTRYHEALDHEVKPVPLKRNSRLGTMQTVNSLFSAAVIQYISNKVGKPLIHKSDVETLSVTQQSDIVSFIKNCYGIPVDINIEEEVERRIDQIKRSTANGNEFFPNVLLHSGNYYYQNQSGMRGIQQSLVLEPNPKDSDIIDRLRSD